jgi:hypothetical protein
MRDVDERDVARDDDAAGGVAGDRLVRDPDARDDAAEVVVVKALSLEVSGTSTSPAMTPPPDLLTL